MFIFELPLFSNTVYICFNVGENTRWHETIGKQQRLVATRWLHSLRPEVCTSHAYLTRLTCIRGLSLHDIVYPRFAFVSLSLSPPILFHSVVFIAHGRPING
jgi:hypothetical protein